MKRALVVLLALFIILIAVTGIVSHLQKERQRAEDAALFTQKPANPGGKSKPQLQDPHAREALALVGTDDTKAHEYWLKAINNPNLPPKEREDLIEDLNEVGFGDPKHPTAAELPMIEQRIGILEKLEAMDEVNAAAIKEAHKDLTRMRERLRGVQ